MVPSSTTAPAAMSDPTPITAPFSTVAPIPIRQSSSTVQPCSTAEWPTLTPRPTVVGMPASQCTETLSWMLLPAPIVIESTSARSTEP